MHPPPNVRSEWVSNLPFDVVVYWINFEGKEEPAMVLPDGMSQYGGTYAGHVSLGVPLCCGLWHTLGQWRPAVFSPRPAVTVQWRSHS